MARPKTENLTPLELEIMHVLWETGPANVQTVQQKLKRELAYTTVLSLLQVMEQKGLVAHRREGKAYVYVPRAERQSTIRRMASSFLEKVFDGAVDEYLVHALESKRLSSDELDQLDAMLASARERSKKGRTKGGRK